MHIWNFVRHDGISGAKDKVPASTQFKGEEVIIWELVPPKKARTYLLTLFLYGFLSR